jgi:hypothetical protein
MDIGKWDVIMSAINVVASDYLLTNIYFSFKLFFIFLNNIQIKSTIIT